MTKIRHLDARKKGMFTYDYNNDLLLFKIKDREYDNSIEFDDFVLDIDTKGFITGIRIFDASKVFKLPKMSLRNVKGFQFEAKIEDKVINLQLRFNSFLRNKKLQGTQNFIREAMDSSIKDSKVECSVA